jgi:hypothetical protein
MTAKVVIAVPTLRQGMVANRGSEVSLMYEVVLVNINCVLYWSEDKFLVVEYVSAEMRTPVGV